MGAWLSGALSGGFSWTSPPNWSCDQLPNGNHMVTDQAHPDNHRIGWWENFNRKALYLMVKTMVSCRFSLKPIHWDGSTSPLAPLSGQELLLNASSEPLGSQNLDLLKMCCFPNGKSRTWGIYKQIQEHSGKWCVLCKMDEHGVYPYCGWWVK